MKILITGATGNLGLQTAKKLTEQGHQIICLSRSADKARQTFHFPVEFIEWDLVRKELPAEYFTGVSAVIHLMGESVDSRWSAEQKNKMKTSRIQSSKNLIAQMPDSVQVVISASAQGYYGNSNEKELTESSSRGQGFLADLCNDWEINFRQLKQRNVQLRISLILDPNTGALKKMIPLFKKYLGARLGSGQQWMSWIAMEDLVEIILQALTNPKFSGAINCSTPRPVRNLDFTKSLAKSLGVLVLPPVPEFVLKIIFGEMSQILLDSIKLKPQKLIDMGFQFQYTELNDYFKSVVKL